MDLVFIFMAIQNLIRRSSRNLNKCKHCALATRCLPARIDRKMLRQHSDILRFKSRVLEAGESLFRQGDLIEQLYLIRSGSLKSFTSLENGHEFIMGFHYPADLFGFEAIDAKQLSTSVVALEHSNVCEIPLSQLETVVQHVPSVETQLMKLVSQRIKVDNHALLRTSTEQRLADFLLEISAHYTLQGYPYYLCKLSMTHQSIIRNFAQFFDVV